MGFYIPTGQNAVQRKFVALVRFRHIVQFFPPLIVYIVPQTIVCRQGQGRYSKIRIAA